MGRRKRTWEEIESRHLGDEDKELMGIYIVKCPCGFHIEVYDKKVTGSKRNGVKVCYNCQRGFRINNNNIEVSY